MANVDVQLGYKDSAWFTANATRVLKTGQTVYLDGTVVRFKRGDGTTQLQNLEWNDKKVDDHIADTANPHGVTKTQVGLGNVQNVDTTTTTNVNEGSNLYFTTTRVLATVLTELVAVSGTPLDTDTVLQAFGKVKYFIDNVATMAMTFTNKSIDLATNTITGTKALFNTALSDGNFVFDDNAALTDARNRKIFSYVNTDYTHTGDTIETVMGCLPLPIMGGNDRSQLELQWGRVGTAASINFKLYIHTASAAPGATVPVGAILAGTLTITGTQLIGGFERRLINKNSTSLNAIYPVSATATTDLTASTSARTTLNVNTATQLYYIISMQCINPADTARLDNAQMYWDRA